MIIKMPRGDIRDIKFNIIDSNETVIPTDFDEIYATFKRGYSDKEVLFQKRLTNGTITKDSSNYYHFTIEPNETNNLAYGEYVFDIEILKENLIKQTFVGEFILTDEVTFAINEV